jgi:hypothetical protein
MEIQMKKQELLQSKAIDPPNFSLIDENFLKSPSQEQYREI